MDVEALLIHFNFYHISNKAEDLFITLSFCSLLPKKQCSSYLQGKISIHFKHWKAFQMKRKHFAIVKQSLSSQL